MSDAKNNKPLVIWRIVDGKPGHESQSLGLAQALERRLAAVTLIDIDISHYGSGLFHWLSGRFPPGECLPAPDYIMAAGHRSHLPLLAARRAFGGKSIVLMKPSLPVSLFDLCIVPEHDGQEQRPNVMVTRGVLNPLNAEGPHHAEQVLMLIGGPSRHHGWDEVGLIIQIQKITGAEPDKRFVLTTSRRTPAGFGERLGQLQVTNLEIIPHERTRPGWVASALADAGSAWVSADSVSMVYEALTSGVRVGLLSVPLKRKGRVVDGLNKLLSKRLVVDFGRWERGDALPRQETPLAEADRSAAWVIEQW